MTQLDLPLGLATAKRPERRSGGRRSIDRLVLHLLASGAIGSVEDLLDQVSAVPGRKLFNALLDIVQLPHATLLATLAHELGHLFCGHLGADQGDGWPSREVHDRTQQEFEAESVARLVFRRVAPAAALPPYLERILAPDQPPPDEGWTYVAQAADRVLDLLAPSRGATHGPPEHRRPPLEYQPQ